MASQASNAVTAATDRRPAYSDGAARRLGQQPSQAHHDQLTTRLSGVLGNSALGSLIQAKLKISGPGDACELEADRVADQVMRMPDSAASPGVPDFSEVHTPRLKRVCEQCEDEMDERSIDKKEKGILQAKETAGTSPQAGPFMEAQVTGTGSGAPLSE